MHIPHLRYTTAPLPRGLRFMIAHRALIAFAESLISLFLPIFLFQYLHGDLVLVTLYYAFVYVLYGILTPIVLRLVVARIGMRRALIIGTLSNALFYTALFLFSDAPPLVLITALVLTGSLTRLFYWNPYFTSFALLSTTTDRARQTSMREALMTTVGAVAPLIAGVLITATTFSTLFLFGVLAYVAAAIPLLGIPPVQERFTWTLRATWRALTARRNRAFVLAYIAEGVELCISAIIWPIVIFLILRGQYITIGAIATGVTILAVMTHLATGHLTDRFPRPRVLRIGSLLYAVGWGIKIFVASATHIFFADLYHRITRIFLSTPFEAMTYDFTARSGHYVDEYSALREISEQIGRAATLLVVAGLLTFTTLPPQSIFLVAFGAAIAMNLMRATAHRAGTSH